MSKQNLDWDLKPQTNKQKDVTRERKKENYSNIFSKELNCHSTGKSIKRKQQNYSKGNNSLYDKCIYIYIYTRRLLHKIN